MPAEALISDLDKASGQKHRPSPTRRWPEHEFSGVRRGHGGASWPWGRFVPRGATAVLLDRVQGMAGQGVIAADEAMCEQEDAPRGGGGVAHSREARAEG